MLKKTIIIAAALAATSTAVFADTYVNGYYRGDGTYVQGHYRSSPNSNPYDNYSSKGNYNPYTGEKGTKEPTRIKGTLLYR